MNAPDAPDLGRVLRDAACRELARARALLGWHGARLHVGVHQGRKSLRRTRAALALAAPVLGRSGRLVDRELRRLLVETSDLRDGQALVEALRNVAARLPEVDAPLFDRAVRVAETRRADLARAAGHAAADRERLDMLGTLHASLHGMPWERVGTSVVLPVLRETDTRIDDAIAAVHADPTDDEAWHEWRRRARRRTQQQRLLAGTSLAVDRKAQHAIGERLGAAQDLSLLLAHCGRDSPFDRVDRRELARRVRELQEADRGGLLAAAEAEAAATAAAAAPATRPAGHTPPLSKKPPRPASARRTNGRSGSAPGVLRG